MHPSHRRRIDTKGAQNVIKLAQAWHRQEVRYALSYTNIFHSMWGYTRAFYDSLVRSVCLGVAEDYCSGHYEGRTNERMTSHPGAPTSPSALRVLMFAASFSTPNEGKNIFGLRLERPSPKFLQAVFYCSAGQLIELLPKPLGPLWGPVGKVDKRMSARTPSW